MLELPLDLRGQPKAEAYEALWRHITVVLDGMDDEIVAMATMSCLIHHAFGFLWTGFYRVVEPGRLLRIGPYQGTLGCLEIAFGHGVCGTAAARKETIVVRNVEEFPGHIACDARAKSEIVVPVADASGELRAVLDVDSIHVGAFDAADRDGLERLIAWFATARPAAAPRLG